ncbi:MAG TPA: VanZ family protein [Ramlibacter sp.]
MSATRFLFRLALLLALVLVTTLLVLPYGVLEGIHARFAWVGRSDAWLTSVWPGLDLDHFAALATLGLLAALAGVRMRLGSAGLALLAFALLTEMAQSLVPGRSPQVSDAVLNVAGGAMGYLLGHVMLHVPSRR